MAFRDSDKSTPKPFSDKKPDNFIQQKPFLDSNLESQVWDDINKLGGKQIAREEIDLIYRAFAEKISSISGEIKNLKSVSKTYSKESIEQTDDIVKKSEDLTENEKEESEKIQSSISSLNDVEDILKVDENLDKQKIEINEKILTKIYEKIVKTISSPSVLIPFITKISEKIYDSITQASSKTFNELNKEFKDQMKIDILGDIKDIAKAKNIETIANNEEDEKAIKHLAEEAKKRKEQEKKDQEKKNKSSSKDEKKNETKIKNSETIETTEIEKIEDAERTLKKESENDIEETITKDSNENKTQQENEDQIVKRSFNSIREALVATQESLNESNQRIKKIWDDTLKINDLEEYSVTSDKDDSKTKQNKKKEEKSQSDSKEESDLNLGRFALLGALAACYFLFKYQNSQANIQRYLESHSPIESMQKEIGDTVESGIEEIESSVQKEIDKNAKENGSIQRERQESIEDNQIIENSISDPEVDKRIEEYGKTISETSVNDYEDSVIEEETVNAKKIEKQLYDSSKENQEKLDEFLNQHKLKNTALDKEIQKRQKEAKEAGEEFQLKLEKLQQDSENAERDVKEYIDEGEKEKKYDKKITDSASGLITTELDIIESQDEIIKDHEQFERDMVENEKKKDAQTKKNINDSFEEVQNEIIANQKNLEEQLKNDPKIAEKLKEAKKQTFREVERSGIEITDFIDKEFTRISNDTLKYNHLLKDENEVIEAATTNNKYVIIDMESYQKMLMCILEIGRDSLSCDNQVTAKIGTPQLR